MIKRLFSSANLKTQFTVINTLFIVFFLVFFGVLGSVSITKWRTNSLKNEMFAELNRINSYVLRNAGICIQTADSISLNQRLAGYLGMLTVHDYDSVLDMMNFYRTDIKSLERMVNSNPLISHIRIYLESDHLLEMAPVVYRLSRASGRSWYDAVLTEKSRWFFDYVDETDDPLTFTDEHFQAAVVSRIRLDKDHYAVIEVAVRMEDLFSGLLWSNPEQFTLFIDENNYIHYDPQCVNDYTTYEELAHYIDFSNPQYQYRKAKINGQPMMLAYLPLDSLDGGLVRIQSLKQEQDFIWGIMLALLAAVILVSFLSFKGVGWVSSKLLQKFYVAIDGVKQIQQGNWDVYIPHLGQNEIGELGKQINIMLERIKSLMNESIKKEIIVRDSQLHTLQNQINAHFLYNVLETIKMMAVIERIYNVSDAITTLGELMRYNIKWKKDSATLADEVGYIKNYLRLINLRSEYEIFLSLKIADGLMEVLIPRMTLQPIIENAIKHGLSELNGNTSIYIKALVREETVYISITDMGSGMDAEALQSLRERIYGDEIYNTDSGIGLKNIYDRIQLLYGSAYGVEVESVPEWFTKIILRIPAGGRCESNEKTADR